MSDCVNLMERFGERFFVGFDPVIDPHGKQRDRIDPMLQVIRCRGGVEIYPQGGELLAVELRNHPGLVRRLVEAGCKIHQQGDGECSLTFDVDLAEAVFEIVKPHRRPQLSDERREQLAEQARRMAAKSSVKSQLIDPKTPVREAG